MSQLNFFLTKDEITAHLKNLLRFQHIQIFKGAFFDTQKPFSVTNIDQLGDFDALTIWVNNKYLEPICSKAGLNDFENKFLFDYYKDPIIEIDNCEILDTLISPGRIYFKAGWIDNKELRDAHKKMANKIKRLFNKNLSTIWSPFKMSKGIRELISKGYDIELGKGGKRISLRDFNGT